MRVVVVDIEAYHFLEDFSQENQDKLLATQLKAFYDDGNPYFPIVVTNGELRKHGITIEGSIQPPDDFEWRFAESEVDIYAD